MPGNDNKSLKVSAQVDSSALKTLNNSLKEIKKTIDDLSKSLGNALNKGFEKLSKEIKLDTKGFDEFKKAINVVDKSLQSGLRNVQSYTRALQGLKAVSGMSSSTSSSGGANFTYGGTGGGGSPIPQLGGGLGGHQLLPLPGGGYIVVPPPGGAGGGGGGGGSPPPTRMQMIQGAAKQLSYFSDFGSNVTGQLQNLKTAPLTNAADIVGLRAQIHQNLLQGDISDALAFFMSQNRNQSLGGIAGGTGLMKTQAGFQAFGGMMGGAMTGTKGGMIAGGLGSLTDLAGKFATGNFDAQEAQNFKTAIESTKRLHPEVFQNMALLQSMAPMLVQGNRRLGGNALGAAGLGAGAGLLPGESIGALSGLANQFGAGTVMGERGRAMRVSDFSRNASFSLIKPGQSPMAAQNTTIGGSSGLGSMVMQLAQLGFDPSMMGQIMGQMGAATPGMQNNLGRGGRIPGANVALTDAISEGVSKGIKDVATLEALAKAVGGAAAQAGSLSGTATLSALLTGGLSGANASPQMIGQRMGGLGALGAGIQGNPLLSVYSRQTAKDILGPGSSALSVKALGGATPLDLLGPNRTLETLFSPEERVAQFQGQMDTLLKRATTGNGREATRLRGRIGNQGIRAFKDEENRRLAAAIISGTFGGFEGQQVPLEFAFQALANLPKEITPNSAKDFMKRFPKLGGAAAGLTGGQATAQIKGLSDLLMNSEAMDAMTRSLGSIKDFMEITNKMPEGADVWSDARETMKSLEHLVQVLATQDPAKIKKLEERIQRTSGK